jgi:hypothetical protein
LYEGIEVPEAIREAVDQVTAHLALLRGGGLFLSSLDARLLVKWLDRGVPASRIVLALEMAAERRRGRRLRSPLKLSSCKGILEKLLAGALQPTAPRVAGLPLVAPALPPPEGSPDTLALAALDAIDALDEPDPTRRADLAMTIVRRFHEEAWRLAEAEHEALRAAASRELEEWAASLEEDELREAVEELARDRLRRRFPMLSASSVWDRLFNQPGVPPEEPPEVGEP